jgi:hypothetical protein
MVIRRTPVGMFGVDISPKRFIVAMSSTSDELTSYQFAIPCWDILPGFDLHERLVLVICHDSSSKMSNRRPIHM